MFKKLYYQSKREITYTWDKNVKQNMKMYLEISLCLVLMS